MWLTSADLMRLSGATARQVDHWTSVGYLVTVGEPSPGTGNKRKFGPAEIYVARVLRVLVRFMRHDSPVNTSTLRAVSARVRAGRTGKYDLVPGVTLDLDVLCAPAPGEESPR